LLKKLRMSYEICISDPFLRKFYVSGGSVRFVNSDGTLSSMQNQNIQVLNPDGTLSALQDSIGQNIRFVTSDGSMVS